MERQIQISIAETTKILFCTISSCSVQRMLDLGFEPDLTIIDEAGQSFECETWPMIFQVIIYFKAQLNSLFIIIILNKITYSFF